MDGVDKFIVKRGLAYCCWLLGWQGGTIHQVKKELPIRLSKSGLWIDDNGVVVTLSIAQQ